MGCFGSKATSGLCQPLIAMMPPHSTYIETHLGGGAIMKRKPPALCSIGIDRDGRVLGAFECDYPVELVHGCAHRFLAEFTFEKNRKNNPSIAMYPGFRVLSGSETLLLDNLHHEAVGRDQRSGARSGKAVAAS